MAARSKPRRGTPPAEWAIAALGGALLLTLLGYLVFLGWRYPESPPEVRARVIDVRPVEAGYVLEFRAVNSGGSSVENVEIEANLLDSGKVVESRSVTLADLPPRADRRGALIFALEPGAYTIALRIEGYTLP